MADHRFPSRQRLHHSSEFDAVFKHARFRVSTPGFLVLASPAGTENRRLGIVVGKKAASKAVERNRLKRLIRESFREDCSLKGLDIVVIARPAARNCPNDRLFNMLRRAWRQLSGELSETE